MPRKPTAGQADRWALAVFCAALPSLREMAAEGFWEDTLAMHIAEVAGGGSAMAACRDLELDLNQPEDVQRDGAGIGGSTTDWLPRPEVIGAYSCPLRRCPRRSNRDADAVAPRCELAGQTMRFVREKRP